MKYAGNMLEICTRLESDSNAQDWKVIVTHKTGKWCFEVPRYGTGCEVQMAAVVTRDVLEAGRWTIPLRRCAIDWLGDKCKARKQWNINCWKRKSPQTTTGEKVVLKAKKTHLTKRCVKRRTIRLRNVIWPLDEPYRAYLIIVDRRKNSKKWRSKSQNRDACLQRSDSRRAAHSMFGILVRSRNLIIG